MATVTPLHLRLVRQEWTDRVPSPAHDSLGPAERRAWLRDHPDSYLGVTRGPEDVEPENGTTTPGAVTAEDLLAEGRQELDRLLETGAFSELRPPGFYLYQLENDRTVQTAVVCGVDIGNFVDGQVKLHERVKAERASHLGRHFEIVGVQSSPIALAHRPLPAMDQLRTAVTESDAPIIDFRADDGLVQRVWAVDEPEIGQSIIDHIASVDLYLIDGHHRTAAALAHRDAVGPGRPDRVLSAIFSSDELHNTAHHRMLATNTATGRFLDGVQASRPVRVVTDRAMVDDRAIDELALYHDGQWFLVTVPFIGSPDRIDDRLANLDPVRLQRGIVGPLLGIDGTGYNDILDYRPGSRSVASLCEEADEKSTVFAMMRPVPIDDLLAASDAGLIMPPKSTYFEPKARSGVFVRPVVG